MQIASLFAYNSRTQWAKNSLALDRSQLGPGVWFTVFLIAFLSIGIIIHSFLINRTNWKRRGWHFVRACTEVSSFAALLSCLLIVLSTIHPNLAKTALCYDFLYGGVAFAVIQLCDNYLCVNRYRAVVRNIPRYKMLTINLYIIIVLTATWLPTYTVVPFFYNTNSNTFWEVYNKLLKIQGWGAVLFNFYFTLKFVVFLNRATPRNEGNISNRVFRSKILAMKSIVHCFTSSVANIVAMYFLMEGALAYICLIPLGLHCLFNCKIDIFFDFEQIAHASRAKIRKLKWNTRAHQIHPEEHEIN